MSPPPAIEVVQTATTTTTPIITPEISVDPEISDSDSSDERSLASKISDEFRPSHQLEAPKLKRSLSVSSISSYDTHLTYNDDPSPTSQSPNMLALGESGALAQNWFSSGTLKADGRWYKDEKGRVCLLRGVNLCGNSKLPTKPNGSSHLNEGFFDHRNVSFVGRPFPLEEVHQHFARLRTWGLTFVRLLVTWESLEHSGP